MPHGKPLNLICWCASAVLTTAGTSLSIYTLTVSYIATVSFAAAVTIFALLILSRTAYRNRVAESRGFRWVLLAIILAIALSAAGLIAFALGSYSLEDQMVFSLLWFYGTVLGLWVFFIITVTMTVKVLGQAPLEPDSDAP